MLKKESNMELFNYQQKIAMMRILFDIIEADGRIDSRELFYFNQLKEEFSLTEDSRKNVDEKNSLMALAQIKLFNDEQKDYFSDLMSKMIVVDEDINVNEVMIYNVVRDFAGLLKPFEGKINPEL